MFWTVGQSGKIVAVETTNKMGDASILPALLPRVL
jgi:hypothetical protein